MASILRDMMAAAAGMLGVDSAVVRGSGSRASALCSVYEKTESGFPSEFFAATLRETSVPIALSESDDLPSIAREMGITATLLVPCSHRGELLAVFAFHHHHRPHRWTEEEIRVATAMAGGAARTISIALQQALLLLRTEQQIRFLQQTEKKVKTINHYLTESVLKRLLPASIADRIAAGELTLDLRPEPRELTVLLSDIVDFTPLSIRLGPRAIANLLDEYLETMTRAVFESGGTVDKFMGDAILVLFGAPETVAVEEQARRAIATARALHRSLDGLNEKWREQGIIGGDIPAVRFRCGIHQGSAIVGMFGGNQRSDYTAIGPTVNFASRLQEAAPANTILVSGSIARYLDQREIIKIESLKLKGIDEEILTYSVSIVG